MPLQQTASLLLHHASDDIDNAPQVRRCVEDLANARDGKMRRWMQSHVRDRVNAIKINNLTLHEVCAHRPTLCEILNDLYAIHVNPEQANATQSETNTQPNSTPSEPEARPAPPVRQLRRFNRST